MAREIRPLSQINAPVKAPDVDVSGVWFINNLLNREFVLSDGSKFKFSQSRQLITDPGSIADLTAISKQPNSRLFFEETAPQES